MLRQGAGQRLPAARRPVLKEALSTAPDPLMLVVSGDIYASVTGQGHGGIDRLVSAEIGGTRFRGWIRKLE